MPELVLMPAPVTTTTLRALRSALATPWSRSSEPGETCWVGIVEGRVGSRGGGVLSGRALAGAV